MIDQLNRNARQFIQGLENRATALRIQANGNLIDFGVNVRGGLEAGLELARICMGGAGSVRLVPAELPSTCNVQVYTDQPGLACMGCQYGGWPVQADNYFAIGSGPIRLRRGREKVLEQYGWLCPDAEVGVAVLESGKLPDSSVLDAMAAECGLIADRVFVCVAPTRSLAGTLQIVARSVEATMHKLFELDVDLNKVTSGFGTAPLPPVSADDLTAIGRTNDAILYGGGVTLWVDMHEDEIKEIGPRTPSNSSGEFGKPFGEIFQASGGDFYKLDPMLFSAAQVKFISNVTGQSFAFGVTRPDIVSASFG